MSMCFDPADAEAEAELFDSTMPPQPPTDALLEASDLALALAFPNPEEEPEAFAFAFAFAFTDN